MSDRRRKVKTVETNTSNENVPNKLKEVVKKERKKNKLAQNNHDDTNDVPSLGLNGVAKDSEDVIPVKKGRKKKDDTDIEEIKLDLKSNGHQKPEKDSAKGKVVENKKGRNKNKVASENSSENNDEPVEELPLKNVKGSAKGDTKVAEEKTKGKRKVKESNNEPEDLPPTKSRKGSAKDKGDTEVPKKDVKKGRRKGKDSQDDEETQDDLPSVNSKVEGDTEVPKKDVKKGRRKGKDSQYDEETQDDLPSVNSKDEGDEVVEKEQKKGKKKAKAEQDNNDVLDEELPSKRRKVLAKDKGEKKGTIEEKKGGKKTKAKPDNPNQPSTSKGRKIPTKDKGDAAENVEEEQAEDKEITADSDNNSEESANEEPPTKSRKVTAKKTATKKKEPLKNKAATDFTEIDFSSKSKTTDGKEWNLKIASWNVDGIRAWLKKGCLDYMKYEKPDILCLQEVKCPQDKLPDELVNIPGYHAYWLCSDKDGYAGVGIYTTKLAISVKYGLDNKELDDEGRIITAEYEQFYLVSTYVPNAGRGLVTLPKRLEWNKAFLDHVKDLDKKKPVIICGDMNVAHNEIDLANPKSNKKNAGFTPEERAGMTDLLGSGFVDTYRHIYPDHKGAYTFWTYMMGARGKNVGWRLDYMIVSERLLPAVCDSIMRSQVYGSDHCPITLFLHLSSAANPKD